MKKQSYYFKKFLILIACLGFLSTTMTHEVIAKTTYDFSESEYHLRISGPSANSSFGAFGAMITGDLDHDGLPDLVVAAPTHDTQSRSNNGSIYIFYNILLDDYLTQGNIIELHETDTFNVRIDGVDTANLGWVMDIADVNNDGRNDLVTGALGTDYNGSSSGSVYVIDNSQITSYSGTGNTHDLNDSSNFIARFDGPAADVWLGDESTHLSDINQDGLPDFFLGAIEADLNGRADSGSLYYIDNALYTSLLSSETGNIIDLSSSEAFTARWDGAAAGDFLSYTSVTLADITDDGEVDLLIDAFGADNNGSYSGSAYIVNGDSIRELSGTGNTFDMSESSNYFIRYDGEESNALLSNRGIQVGDVNNDGVNDLLLSANRTSSDDFNGNLFFLDSSLVLSKSGSGNNVIVSGTNTYSAKVTGQDRSFFGDRVFINDYDNDGKKEVFAGTGGFTDNRYVLLSESIYEDFGDSPQSYSLDDESNVRIEFLPESGTNFGGEQSEMAFEDFNNDSVRDFTITHRNFSIDGLTNAGATYIFYTFPHTVSVSGTSGNALTNDGLTVTGSVSAPQSFSTVTGVQYAVDTNDPQGEWYSCSANDSSFDSTTENFSCTISNLPNDDYQIYIRSVDVANINSGSLAYASTGVSSEDRGFKIRSAQNVGGKGQDALSPNDVTHENQVVFAWHQSESVSHYKVYTRRHGTDTWDETTLSSSEDSYERYFDEGDYEWKIRAVHNNGEVTDTPVYEFSIVSSSQEGSLSLDTINFQVVSNSQVFIVANDFLQIVGTAIPETNIYTSIRDTFTKGELSSFHCHVPDFRSEFVCEVPAELFGSYILEIEARDDHGHVYGTSSISVNTY